MSKFSFSVEKRYALWIANNKRCQYCSEPLNFDDVWVDHILPESLLTKPVILKELLDDYGLDNDLQINNYENWLATHSRCNRNKRNIIFNKSAALYFINIAKSKKDKAIREETRLIKNNEIVEAISILDRACKRGLITKEKLKRDLSLDFWYLRFQTRHPETIVVTFGLEISNVLSNLKENKLLDYPADYPSLCDWLEKNLINELTSTIKSEFYYTEESYRNGETLSIRFGFPQLNLNELDKLKGLQWEITEVGFYSDIYGIDEEEEYWFKEW